MRHLTVGLAAAILLGTTGALADPIPGLSELVGETVAASESSCLGEPEGSEAWYFKTLMIRVRPQAGFEIPALAKIQVVLETELVFLRDNPEGWVAYKPTVGSAE